MILRLLGVYQKRDGDDDDDHKPSTDEQNSNKTLIGQKSERCSW
jgi:hypothetical protein